MSSSAGASPSTFSAAPRSSVWRSSGAPRSAKSSAAGADRSRVGGECARRTSSTRDRLRQPENRRPKKFLTLWPNETAPSLMCSQVVLAFGSAALPASFSLSPVNLAPSTTVLPIPLAVSSTPWPILPSPIFLAPVSTWLVPALTFESSAVQPGSAQSMAKPRTNAMMNALIANLPHGHRILAFILPTRGDRPGDTGPPRGDLAGRAEGNAAELAGVTLRAHTGRVGITVALVVLLALIQPVEGASPGAHHAADRCALAGTLATAGDGAAGGPDRRPDHRADRGVLHDLHGLVTLSATAWSLRPRPPALLPSTAHRHDRVSLQSSHPLRACTACARLGPSSKTYSYEEVRHEGRPSCRADLSRGRRIRDSYDGRGGGQRADVR